MLPSQVPQQVSQVGNTLSLCSSMNPVNLQNAGNLLRQGVRCLVSNLQEAGGQFRDNIQKIGLKKVLITGGLEALKGVIGAGGARYLAVLGATAAAKALSEDSNNEAAMTSVMVAASTLIGMQLITNKCEAVLNSLTLKKPDEDFRPNDQAKINKIVAHVVGPLSALALNHAPLGAALGGNGAPYLQGIMQAFVYSALRTTYNNISNAVLPWEIKNHPVSIQRAVVAGLIYGAAVLAAMPLLVNALEDISASKDPEAFEHTYEFAKMSAAAFAIFETVSTLAAFVAKMCVPGIEIISKKEESVPTNMIEIPKKMSDEFKERALQNTTVLNGLVGDHSSQIIEASSLKEYMNIIAFAATLMEISWPIMNNAVTDGNKKLEMEQEARLKSKLNAQQNQV